MKKQDPLKRAITAVALAGALAGLGAGVADAKPMERDHKKYCAKIYSDMERTGAIWVDARSRYGSDDRLTLQARSNYDRAVNAVVGSSC